MEYRGWRAMPERPSASRGRFVRLVSSFPLTKAARHLGAAVALPNGWRERAAVLGGAWIEGDRRSCRDEAAGAPVEGGLELFGAARLPAAPRGGGRGRPRRRRTVTAFSESAAR